MHFSVTAQQLPPHTDRIVRRVLPATAPVSSWPMAHLQMAACVSTHSPHLKGSPRQIPSAYGYVWREKKGCPVICSDPKVMSVSSVHPPKSARRCTVTRIQRKQTCVAKCVAIPSANPIAVSVKTTPFTVAAREHTIHQPANQPASPLQKSGTPAPAIPVDVVRRTPNRAANLSRLRTSLPPLPSVCPPSNSIHSPHPAVPLPSLLGPGSRERRK